MDTIHALQNQLDELQEQKDQWMQSVNDQQDMSVVREELKRQAEYLRQLEGTNARLNAELLSLRDRHASVEVLREQNRSLESKLAYTESLRQKVASLEAELDAARQERETWYDSFSFCLLIPDLIYVTGRPPPLPLSPPHPPKHQQSPQPMLSPPSV
jgi:mitotic spindle assembly checkpoint protein MAD1